jgi:ribosome-associated protein
MGEIRIGRLVIPSSDVVITVSTPGGPGGQHANTTQSRVVATFDHRHSEALSDTQRARLLSVRATPFSASSSRHRSQLRNKEEALERLTQRLREALVPPTPRRATRPTKSSQVRRLDSKKRQSAKKKDRQIRDD